MFVFFPAGKTLNHELTPLLGNVSTKNCENIGGDISDNHENMEIKPK